MSLARLRSALTLGGSEIKPDVMLLDGRPVTNLRYAHEMVVDVAKGLAGALYENIMWDDGAWKAWKLLCPELNRKAAESEFIRLAWPHLLDDARATLAKMLGPGGREDLKPLIHDALCKDNLIRGTNGLVPVKQAIEGQYHGRR